MQSEPHARLVITLPDWIASVTSSFAEPLTTDERKMQLTVLLSRRNIERGGGPFGATVFRGDELVGVGVNRVMDSGFSLAHAEILALLHAQQVAGTDRGTLAGDYTLFASTEPCCQCFGALVWSGVRRLVCGATTDDAESVGFDEGPKPPEWDRVLEARGIRVSRAVEREAARAVLRDYASSGGVIYGLGERDSGH